MRTILIFKVLLAISIVFMIFSLACEEEKNPTEIIQGIQVEAVEDGKLNAIPILGYMQDAAYLAPAIDGIKSEAVWDNALAYELPLEPDENGFAPTVTLYALYDNWYLYLLAEWEDPSKDEQPDFWWFGNSDVTGTSDVAIYDTIFTKWVTADSSYKPQRKPVKRALTPQTWSRWSVPFSPVTKTIINRANVDINIDSTEFTTTWDTTYTTWDTLTFSGGEDGLAMMWNINVSNFLNCTNLCHGNSSLSTDQNESADIWAWYAYRTNNKRTADDLALLNTGFVGDDGDSCFWDNTNADGTLPSHSYMFHPDRNADVVYDTTSITYYASLDWFTGNYIPGYILQNPSGNRADVRAVANYNNGKWYLEMSRKLNTADVGNDAATTDIQFNPDSVADVSFHLVVYNNSRGKNHAATTSVQILHFVQLKKEE